MLYTKGNNLKINWNWLRPPLFLSRGVLDGKRLKKFKDDGNWDN